MNAHLSTRTFLVGERVTLADLVVASAISTAVTVNLDAALRAELPHVIRHFETVINQPKIKEFYPAPEYVEKPIQFVPPPKEKKEPAKVEEKKPKKAAAAAEDDEEDKPFVEEPKAKNPLDSLPKSTFNLEDWKRAYSNKDTRGPDGALEWFYQK